MPEWLVAGGWGLLAGSALLVGAAAGFYVHIDRRIIAAIMAFGAGVLISALSFDLMDEAYRRGGFVAAAIGFLSGAAIYSVANIILARRGAKHRKRSGDQQASDSGSGTAIALGALLDGIPESIVIGVSLLGAKSVSLVAVAAVFLSNVPEGMSSSAGMRRSGRGPAYVFGVWSVIALVSGIAAALGNLLFRDFDPRVIAATTATAAGAILAMIADTMMPEAFESAHDLTGVVTVLGFLCAFLLSKLGG
ncbi:MAG TPA: ZIP family zinc transporter [Thermoanaerobaculia bacterium]|nr:ZIP family zinc transporter [Thermoanaerobaculia bacterium]